jgi:hypothetical protein
MGATIPLPSTPVERLCQLPSYAGRTMLWRRLALGALFASIVLLLLVASANPMEGGPCSPSGDIGGERFDSGGVYLSEWRSFPPGSKTCRLYDRRQARSWREEDT